jgi:hypothetical protein
MGMLKWVRRPTIAGLAATLFLVLSLSGAAAFWQWQTENNSRQRLTAIIEANNLSKKYDTDLADASRYIRTDYLDAAQRTLDDCPRDMRDQTW